MAERVTHEDGTLRVQAVQHRTIRGGSGGLHALLKPADHLKPAVRFVAAVSVEARLDAPPEFLDREPFVVERTANLVHATFERMHVRVGKTGHHEAAFKINDPRLVTDKGIRADIRAGVDDPSALHSDRFDKTIARVGGIDVSVSVNHVRRGRGHSRGYRSDGSSTDGEN